MVCHCYIIVLATWYCKFDLSLFSNAPKNRLELVSISSENFFPAPKALKTAGHDFPLLWGRSRRHLGCSKNMGLKGLKILKPWIVEGKDPQEPQVLTKSRVFLQIFYTFSLKRNSFQLWSWAPHIDTPKWMVQRLRATIDVSIHSLQRLSSVRAPSDFAGHQKIIPYWSCWVIHKKQNNT